MGVSFQGCIIFVFHYFLFISFALCLQGCVGIMMVVSITTANDYYGAASAIHCTTYFLLFFFIFCSLFSILYRLMYYLSSLLMNQNPHMFAKVPVPTRVNKSDTFILIVYVWYLFVLFFYLFTFFCF